jgi:hypothetical protein
MFVNLKSEMWIYTVRNAKYGEDDVASLLQSLNLQNGRLHVGKVFGRKFEKNKILEIIWELKAPAVDDTKSIISARCANQHLQDKKFIAK